MPTLTDHLGPFLMVAFRLSGVLMLAPILASVAIPGKVRVLLVAVLAVAVYPTLPPEQQRPMSTDLFSASAMACGEVLIGMFIGLLALLPVAAVQLGGMVMGLQMGFGLASVVNPALETESEPIGELLTHLAIFAFLLMGGLEGAFLAVCKTFAHIPLGGFDPATSPLALVTGVLSGGFELAIRVSLPLMGIIMMETVATAFLSKTLPTLNIMSIGFAVKIIIGLGALMLGLRAIDEAIGDHVTSTGRSTLHWAAGG